MGLIVVSGWSIGSEDCSCALGAVVGAGVDGDIGAGRGPGFEIQGLPGRGKKVERGREGGQVTVWILKVLELE